MQFTAVRRPPLGIEIDVVTHDAGITVAMTVEMTPIKRAWRIKGEMALKYEKPEKQDLVEREPQRFQFTQKCLLRSGGLCAVQPGDVISACLVAHLRAFAATDGGAAQPLRLMAAINLRAERVDQLGRENRLAHRPAPAREIGGDLVKIVVRRHGRSRMRVGLDQ